MTISSTRLTRTDLQHELERLGQCGVRQTPVDPVRFVFTGGAKNDSRTSHQTGMHRGQQPCPANSKNNQHRRRTPAGPIHHCHRLARSLMDGPLATLLPSTASVSGRTKRRFFHAEPRRGAEPAEEKTKTIILRFPQRSLVRQVKLDGSCQLKGTDHGSCSFAV
jgi:hypothetical protein